MIARVAIHLKHGVLDPQGRAIEHALTGLGFENIAEVRQGKVIEIAFEPTIEADEARAAAAEMCRRLLVNPVTERHTIEIVESAPAP